MINDLKWYVNQCLKLHAIQTWIKFHDSNINFRWRNAAEQLYLLQLNYHKQLDDNKQDQTWKYQQRSVYADNATLASDEDRHDKNWR